MVHSTTALAVLTAALLSTGATAHMEGLGARHAHVAPHKKAASAVAEAARSLIPDMDKIRRTADDILARSTGSTSASQKKKRKIKKRKNTCVPQVGFNVSRPTSAATRTQSASQIGNEWGVSTTQGSAPSSTPTSASNYNSLWTLEDTWVSATRWFLDGK
jgi:hypothetical protein